MEPVSTIALAALILASKSGAEELGKDAGQSAWAGLSKLRALVGSKFRADGQGMQALVEAEQHPQNAEAVVRLEEALASSAGRDTRFAAELESLVAEAGLRPEYRAGSQLFVNYGWVGKMNIFNAPIRVQEGGFHIS